MGIPLPDPAQISQIAQDATTILAPHLPAILAAGGEIVKGALGKAGEIGFEGIWNTLRPKTETNPNLKRALERVAARPDDVRVKGALEAEIEDVLRDDPPFAAQMSVVIYNYNFTHNERKGGIDNTGEINAQRDVVGGDSNKRDEYNAQGSIYVFQTAHPEPRGNLSLEQYYLRRLAAACSELPFGILDPRFFESGGAGALTVQDIYINLDVMAPAIREQEGSFLKRILKRVSQDVPEKTPDRTPIVDALGREDLKRVVLLGEMGSGKSTFAQYIAFALALIQLESPNATALLPENSLLANLFPVRLVLREAARHVPVNATQGNAQMLWNALRSELVERLGSETDADAYLPELRERIRSKPTLILFDGLDEVPEAISRRIHLLQAISDFCSALPKETRILVTARPYAYQDKSWQLARFEILTLAPFNDDQIERFIQNWYQAVRGAMQVDEQTAKGKAAELRDALAIRQDLADIATRPLLLTLMATLSTSWGTLPIDRFGLYDEMVNLLLSRWQRARLVFNTDGTWDTDPGIAKTLQVDESAIRRALYQLAFNAHQQQWETKNDQEPADISEGAVLEAFSKILDENTSPVLVLRYLNTRAGLLSSRKAGIYAFPHRSFQEFLAAQAISARVNSTGVLRELVRQDAHWWREVALWTAGIKGRGGVDNIIAIVNHLVPDSHTNISFSDSDYRSVILAGMILNQERAKPIHEPVYAAPFHRVVHALVHLVETGQLAARERVEAGDVLGSLGDPRPGIYIPPLLAAAGQGVRAFGVQDILWCEIPAGDFLMGSSKNQNDSRYDADPSDDELGQAEKYKKITRPFYISCYPITNAQFDVFLQSTDGFRNSKWWNGLAKCDNTSPPPKYGGVFDLPNHPVVYVTWYQAVAFTRWLNQSLPLAKLQVRTREGMKFVQTQAHSSNLNAPIAVRLPTEAEWEKAARGTDGKKYPWGNQITPDHANYSDTGIGSTSAVGSFPKGMNAYGVMDQCGNVWEWTSTKWTSDYSEYEQQEENRLEGDIARVVRGGAFRNGAQQVRCASRFLDSPVYHYWLRGFRVVVASA